MPEVVETGSQNAPLAPAPNLGVVSPPEAPAASGDTSVQNTGDQATPAKPDGEQQAEVESPEKVALRESRRKERKLGNALRREAEARAKADLLERRIQELEKQQPAPKDAGAPKLEDFTDVEEFRKAVEQHARESERKESATKQQTEAQQRALSELTASWAKTVDAGNDKYDDFDEIIGDLKPESHLHVAIMETESADVAYYLGTHRDELLKIAQLSPRLQIRAIAKLEAKLAAEPPKPKTPSAAPAPVKPVSGGGGHVVKTLAETSSYDEFVKLRRAQLAQKH